MKNTRPEWEVCVIKVLRRAAESFSWSQCGIWLITGTADVAASGGIWLITDCCGMKSDFTLESSVVSHVITFGRCGSQLKTAGNGIGSWKECKHGPFVMRLLLRLRIPDETWNKRMEWLVLELGQKPQRFLCHIIQSCAQYCEQCTRVEITACRESGLSKLPQVGWTLVNAFHE